MCDHRLHSTRCQYNSCTSSRARLQAAPAVATEPNLSEASQAAAANILCPINSIANQMRQTKPPCQQQQLSRMIHTSAAAATYALKHIELAAAVMISNLWVKPSMSLRAVTWRPKRLPDQEACSNSRFRLSSGRDNGMVHGQKVAAHTVTATSTAAVECKSAKLRWQQAAIHNCACQYTGARVIANYLSQSLDTNTASCSTRLSK